MRKGLTIAAAVLAAVLFSAPAMAQQTGGDGGAQVQGGKKIPPSAAVKRAVRSVPGAEPLGVKLKGDTYIVRLKQDGSVVRWA